MLKVPIDKIMPVTEVRANISKVINDVEGGDLYVLTRGGKPTAVIAPIDYIKKCTETNNTQKTVPADAHNPRKVQKNNYLVEKHELDNLPAKIVDTDTAPVVFEKKPDDIALKNDEETIPIKVNTANWDE